MKAAVIAGIILSTVASKVIDYATLETVAKHQCFLNSGVNVAIPRAYRSIGVFDTNGPSNVAYAHAAGIPNVHIYMFPCRGKDAATQVNEMI